TPASLKYKISHFALADKLPKLFREANILYWAKALLGLVYNFIDHAVASASEFIFPVSTLLKLVWHYLTIKIVASLHQRLH
ncbi:uncharacterized protein F5891DRAFT_966074, partial [Suillus fuscotomentosus]